MLAPVPGVASPGEAESGVIASAGGALCAAALDPTALRAALAAVPDPEVPVITIEDLGILRSVTTDEVTRTALVVITPTYSGCPAMDAIARRVRARRPARRVDRHRPDAADAGVDHRLDVGGGPRQAARRGHRPAR